MKTDPLFYEMFQAAPQTFFELAQITPTCPYRFESITVKTSEKRIDGVLEPTVAGQPFYFLEVQAFPDKTIYWRTMREIATFFEQRNELVDQKWYASILWINKSDDPGFGTLRPLARKPGARLLSLDLIEILKKLPESSLALNVLRPLLAENEREVRQNVVQWIEKIRQTPNLEATTEERLISVFSQIVEQKFKSLNYKELTRMLRLTPFRETTSYIEASQEDHVEILTRQFTKKFALSSEMSETITADLKRLDLRSMKTLLDLVFEIDTVEQLERWITDRLSKRRRRTHRSKTTASSQ